MRARAVLPAATVLVAALSLLAREAEPPIASGPVLVELFTSQGCSSCPPADRLLSELALQPEVAALAFHVDYWNWIGWTDPFSSDRWSDRQRAYARRMGAASAYTPQLVVNGRRDVVGSRRGDVARELATAAPLPRIGLTAEATSEGLAVHCEVPPVPACSRCRLLLAVTESGLETPVASGENAGRSLRNDHVVRWLGEVTEVAPGRRWSGGARAPLEPDWRRSELRLVSFLQEGATFEVRAVGALRLETLSPGAEGSSSVSAP